MSAFLESREGRRAVARTAPEAREFMRSPDGWHVVTSKGGNREGGVVAHRGVLHPDEYVDMAQLVPAVERRLGFTLAELRAVYRQGRKSAAQRELRDRIDARLLEVGNAGGNLELLARVTGVDRDTIGRALTRARVARGERLARPSHLGRRKDALARRDGGARCRYCGQRAKLRDLTVDHVVPLARGGSNSLTNLALSCRSCNGAKGSHELHEAFPSPPLTVTEELAPKWGESCRRVFERTEDLVPLGQRERQESGLAVIGRFETLGGVVEAGLAKLPGEREHVRVTNLKTGEHHATDPIRTRVRSLVRAVGPTPTEEK